MSIEALAVLRQPWWQAPQFTQAWRIPQEGWCRSRVSTAAGASEAAMPSCSHPRTMMSAGALRSAGGCS